jgi:hypothetical protein
MQQVLQLSLAHLQFLQQQEQEQQLLLLLLLMGLQSSLCKWELQTLRLLLLLVAVLSWSAAAVGRSEASCCLAQRLLQLDLMLLSHHCLHPASLLQVACSAAALPGGPGLLAC